ncbi:MAG: DUF2306 domain-containing protein [bacterium]|jgi:uncharacterized membrane protein
MQKIYKSLITASSVFIGAYAFFVYGFLELGVAVHPIMKANFKANSIGIYLHIFPSLIALVLGPLQFNEKFRTTKTHLHRSIGKVYLLCILVGGLSGLYMAQFSFGGTISHLGFALLAVLWILTGYKAYSSIINKLINAHYQWMVINFALTFAAVTLRIGLGIGFGSGIAFETFYPYLAWLCWVPNLLIALIIIRKNTSTM